MASGIASLSLDQLSIDTLRLLALDAVEKANSGHPGAPLGCAPISYLLFHKLMKHNPAHSKWADRDRFLLSNGHASAMLYGTLFLCGYKVTLDDLKSFRRWGSITPGHPEYGLTDGVEATTGPLGQGFGMGVGMAIAERHLAATYNKPGFNVVDHHTFVLCGDGDLMEGVSHEAASLAGTLGLGKLIVLYDDNLISLDGPTEWSFTEDVYKRFEAYNWHVQRVMDGNDLDGIEAAIGAAKAVTDKPSLIGVRTVIGYGSPKAGTNKVHGEAMSAEDTAATKKFFGFPEDQSFYVPEDALKNWREAEKRGAGQEAEWNKLFAGYKSAFPELAAEFERTQAGKLKAGWEKTIPSFPVDKPVATRNAGQTVMNAIFDSVPELFRRRGGFDGVDEDDFQEQRALCRRSGGAQCVFWRARAGNVRGGERNGGSRRGEAVRIDILRFFRLRQAGAADCGHHGGAVAVCVHARLDRRGRGWTDARADRAPDGAARGAAHDGFPSGGCE